MDLLRIGELNIDIGLISMKNPTNKKEDKFVNTLPSHWAAK